MGNIRSMVLGFTKQPSLENKAKTEMGPAGRFSQKPLEESPATKLTRLFILDTCYLIQLARAGYGVYRSLKELSQKGDIIITEQVVHEFKRHVDKQSITELHRAIIEGVVAKEEAAVTDQERAAMGEAMAKASEKKNSRVGSGEASILKLLDIVDGLYHKITVLSADSDVRLLLSQVQRVNVAAAV